MTAETNKALVRKHFERVWNQGDATAVAATLAPDYVGHDPNSSGAIRSPNGYLTATAAFRMAFPEARFTIEELLARGTALSRG
jgi:predicted ester cyclase